MNKIQKYLIASGLWLLTILFCSQSTFAQIPKLFIKCFEVENQKQSGYFKIQQTYKSNTDSPSVFIEEGFFVITPKDFKYSYIRYWGNTDISFCKSANTVAMLFDYRDINKKKYRYAHEVYDAKNDDFQMDYPSWKGLSLDFRKDCQFSRIPPKLNRKNIRFKLVHPNNDIDSNYIEEFEFDRKNLHLVQFEISGIYMKTEKLYTKCDIIEYKQYNYIHPDILDTISFKYDELKSGFDKQTAMEQAIKDSLWNEHLYDSLALIFNKNAKLVDTIPNNKQAEISYFMPSWQFPLLSGDTLYSDSIQSRFLLLDMWYIACHPCRMAMRELAGFETLFDESLLKMVSLNIADKDTARMGLVVRSLNLKCDIACTFDNLKDQEMSKKMGNCKGFPQIYLVDMKTKKVIWNSCGWYEGFTKDVEKIVREEAQKGNE